MNQPVAFDVLDDQAMVPVYPRIAARTFEPGTRVLVVLYEQRSQASHNFEFGWLAEAWKNLPEVMAEDVANPEMLRKRALIATGWYEESTVDAGSQAAAQRVAAFMRGGDGFALIVTRGPIVVRRTAKSQSRRAMGKADFERSKTDIIEWVSAQIGVTPETLRREAGRAA